jgi:hypothetical protein
MSGYIGTQPVPQATQTRDAFTATNNQTSFPTSGYTPEFLDVFLNGVKLAASDYTATNGSDVVLAAGATTGDILEVVSYGTFEVLNPTFDGNVTFTGNASFGDNDKAIFGDGSDLQIYHDGSNSHIKDTGAGDLLIEGSDNIWLMQSGGAKVFLNTIDSNAINLYFNNSKKLETTNTGIYVTGTVAATAYTGDGSALTGTGSPSIDDNGNATAITIDSSENVQFGTTQTFPAFNNVVGCEVGGFGQISASRDGAEAMQLNRKSSDGNIAVFKKDGSDVGSIGTSGGDLIISGRTSSAKSGIRFDNNTITPAVNGADVDASVDLGYSSRRFKDAYLSGGVYLGGTGSANKLDDYEEGTWTPAVASATNTPTFHNNVGRYTKIGRVVTLQFFQQTNLAPTFASDTDVFYITGLPFSVSGSGYSGSQGSMNAQGMHFNGDKNNQNVTGQVSPSVVNAGGVALNFQVTPNAGTRGQVNHRGAKQGYIIEATITYFTDA